MSDADQYLREKVIRLLAVEREVFGLRRRYGRQGLWLALGQALPRLVDAKLEPAEICDGIAQRMKGALELQSVLFFELLDGTLRRVTSTSERNPAPLTFVGAAKDLLARQNAGVCQQPDDEGSRGLGATVGLHRFLWCVFEVTQGWSLLFAAGYDEERAAFYAPFDADDIGHFENTAHQIELLFRNQHLVRELEREKRVLQQFNTELERRVEERTRSLAQMNDELGHALNNLRNKESRLAEDIDQARLFQERLLSDLPPPRAAVEFHVAYSPVERVGGDVFDVYERSPNHFRIFIADATGHGVQASMRTILVKTEYDRLKAVHQSPHRLLQDLSERLVTLFPDGEMMSTACCLDLVVDDEGALITYSNAANPPLALWPFNGVMREVWSEGVFLAVDASEWPDPMVFRIEEGDTLLIYTDGLSEQTNREGRPFEHSMKAFQCAEEGLTQWTEALLDEFRTFHGDVPIADDVTLVSVRLPVLTRRRSMSLEQID